MGYNWANKEMKKLLLVFVAIIGFAFAANAQQHNLGVRLGTGGELSYQMGIGEINRLEVDLGVNGFLNWKDYHYFALTGIFQWHWYLVDKFGIYVGPGAQVSFVQPKAEQDAYFNVSLGGQVGIDYEFPVPLQLSLDFRPMWNFLGYYSGFGWGTCLGIRYMF